MMTNKILFQYVRTVVYYGGVLISVGLIWGGGLTLLRGTVLEGLVAIVIGILLQFGLRRFGIDRQPVPNSDGDRMARDFLRNLEKGSEAKVSIAEGQHLDKPSMRQTMSGGQRFKGTDGAILERQQTPRLAARLVALDDSLRSPSFAEEPSGDTVVFIVDGESIIASCSRKELLHYIQKQSDLGGS